MTNKFKWFISICVTFAMLLLIWLFCFLSWNFPYFADVMDRSFGGVVPKEDFAQRLVCYAMLLPFFARGIVDFIDLFPDDTKKVDTPQSKLTENSEKEI